MITNNIDNFIIQREDKLKHCTQRAVWRKRGSGSPERLCEFGSLSPVRASVKAPPAPSRWDVVCNAGKRSAIGKRKKT